MFKMSYSFDIDINNAIKICNGQLPADGSCEIYPFTTENISGYINYFDLIEKSLLTVGSSGDQVINAILHGCEDITLLDKNPYSKYYYYLKITGILCLELDAFMEFFRYKDYPKVFKDNNHVFDKVIFSKIKPTLRSLDYESYLFWDELFQTFDSRDIRSNLFSSDEYRTSVISNCNDYLNNEELYNKIKKKIKKINPNFIYGDLLKLDLDSSKKYDNIWLSNIGTYLPRHFVKIMTDKMSKLLNENGQLLISYLYKTTKDTKYQEDWCPIYNLERTFEILWDYSPELISFIGVDGIKFEDENFKDSILVYRKH